MYRGFKLKINKIIKYKEYVYTENYIPFQTYYDLGFLHQIDTKKNIKKKLDYFLLNDGSLDGSAIQNDWFPQIEADVFISHSHADEELAIFLAGLLKDLGIKSFIDSTVWGYSNHLLKEIDNQYCKNNYNDYYLYDKRNISTSHVHMMLSTALTMMMDKAECLLFLNTPNSIKTSDIFKSQTESPWIYHEISTSKLIGKKTPDEHRNFMKKANYSLNENLTPDDERELKIKYNADLSHLNEINFDLFLNEIINTINSDFIDVDIYRYHFLDHLYKNF